MEPLLSPQVNAVLQVAIVVILLASLGFKRKRKYWSHGALTLVAAALNLLSFLLVMLPSALRTEIIQTQPLHIVSIVTLSHSTIGVVAILLSVWLVVTWRLRWAPKDCFRKKKVMRATIVLWMLSLILGFLLYGYLHTTLIP